MSKLATAYEAAGKLDLALPLFEEALSLTKAKLGRDHPDTVNAMNQLARTYWMAKRLDKSIPLFEEAIKRREATLGRQPAAPRHAEGRGGSGRELQRRGPARGSLAAAEESYRAAKKYPSLQWVGHQLLDGYVQAGRTDQAAALAKEMLAAARATLPGDSPQLPVELAFLGQSLLQAKAFAGAEPPCREFLAICEKRKPNGWSTFSARSMLGSALLGLKKYDEAEPLLLQGYEVMTQHEAEMPAPARVHLNEALERLIDLHESRGGAGDAEMAVKYHKLLEQRQSAGE